MVVSIELFFLVQSISGLCLLTALSRTVCTGPAQWGRLTICALGGGCVSLAGMMFGNSLAWLLCALMMNLLLPMFALPQLSRLRRLRASALYFVMTMVLDGSARILAQWGLPSLPSIGLAAAGSLLLPRLRRSTQPVPVTRVEVRWRGRSVCLSAMLDSGNLLHDMITGLPVIVCSEHAMEHVVPRMLPGMLPEGFRFLSVRTAAGSTLMPCFRPDSVRLLFPGGWAEVQAIIGLSVCGYNGFQALVPAALAEERPLTPPSGSLTQGG